MFGNDSHMTDGNAQGADLRVSKFSFDSFASAGLILLDIIEIM